MFKYFFRVAIVCILLSLMGGLELRAQGIHFFKGTWEEALAKAEKEHKLIFLDCFTTWCQPCLEMAAETFTQKEVGDLFNEQFISVKLDMKKDQGPGIGKKYAVIMYPTLMFISPDGYEVSRVLGKQKKSEVMSWAKGVAGGNLNISLDKQFDEGKRDPLFLEKYFNRIVLDRQLSKLDSVIKITVKEKGDTVLYGKPYFDVIQWLDIDSKEVLFFSEHIDKFVSRFGSDVAYQKMGDIYVSFKQSGRLYSQLPPRALIPGSFAVFENRINERNLPFSDFLKSVMKFHMSISQRDFLLSNKLADSALVNGKAWQYLLIAKIYEFSIPSVYKDKGVKWLDHAISLAKDETIKNQAIALRERYLDKK